MERAQRVFPLRRSVPCVEFAGPPNELGLLNLAGRLLKPVTDEFYEAREMNKPLRPTAEAIEAALSAYQEGAVYNDDFEFIKIMSSNDILKAHLHGLTHFLTEVDLPALEAVFPPETLRLL